MRKSTRNAKLKLIFVIVITIILNPVFAQYEWHPTNSPSHSFLEYSNKYLEDQLVQVQNPGKFFYVSINGSDNNDGAKKTPFRTIEAARDAIRYLKESQGLPIGGVHVVILNGTYQINNTVAFSTIDSGTEKAPIVYKGEEAGKVVLTGGVSLDTKRFKLVSDDIHLDYLHPNAKGKVIFIDLTKDGLDDCFPGCGKYGQITMDGYMLQLSQWPNRGYNHIDEILDEGPTTRWLKPGEKPMSYTRENPTGGKFRLSESLSPAIQKEFERTGDMQAQGYFHNDWYFQDESVGGIESDVIQLLRYTRYGIVKKIKSIPRRVRLLNVLSELDEPGEWYFDKKEKRLYVWPINGFEAGKSTLTIIGNQSESINDSFEQPGSRQSGKTDQAILKLENTSYVTFRDLIIENTSDLAVNITGGEYNLIAGTTVRNGAGKGVVIKGGKHNGISGCDFYDLYSAFSISGGDWKTLEHCYNFSTNNIIRNCRYRGYGVIGLSGVGIYFAHNLLHSMNGSVMYETADLLMEYNEFYNIGYEMGDFNVAYCGAQWHTMNNVLRYNFVHHLIEPGGHPVFAFRNDDGGAGLKIYGNVFYRSGRGGGIFHGPGNDFQNNITMNTPVMWWTLKKKTTPEGIQADWDALSRFGTELPKGDKGDHVYITEKKIGIKGWEKSPWIDIFPELKAIIETNPWAQTFCQVNLNYAYKIREEFHIHGGSGTIEGLESKEVGKFADLPNDVGIFELPKQIDLNAFVDVTTLDFRFKAGFKPMQDFKPIPFQKIGLVKDEFRKSIPNKKEYRKAIYKRFENEIGGRYNAKIVNARYPIPSYM